MDGQLWAGGFTCRIRSLAVRVGRTQSLWGSRSRKAAEGGLRHWGLRWASAGVCRRQWVVPLWAVLPLSSKTQKHPTYQPEWVQKRDERGTMRRDEYSEERGSWLMDGTILGRCIKPSLTKGAHAFKAGLRAQASCQGTPCPMTNTSHSNKHPIMYYWSMHFTWSLWLYMSSVIQSITKTW